MLIKKRQQLLLLQFREALSVLSSFLSAGYSSENALQSSLPELIHLFGEDALIVREYRLILKGIEMNRPVEELFADFGRRSGLDDIMNFAEIYIAARRSGGELVRIVSHASDVIRDKLSVKEEILTVNASRRYEQKIMNLLPFFIILYMNFTSPDFFFVLYTTLAGRLVMTGCLAVYVLAVLLAERILQIEV